MAPLLANTKLLFLHCPEQKSSLCHSPGPPALLSPLRLCLFTAWHDIYKLTPHTGPPPPTWTPTGPLGSILQASLLLSRQSKSTGSKFLVTLCYIQSAHKNMQTPSKKYCLSPSQIFILVCFNLCRNNIMRQLQRKTFSLMIYFLLLLLLLGWRGFLCFSFFGFCFCFCF